MINQTSVCGGQFCSNTIYLDVAKHKHSAGRFAHPTPKSLSISMRRSGCSSSPRTISICLPPCLFRFIRVRAGCDSIKRRICSSVISCSSALDSTCADRNCLDLVRWCVHDLIELGVFFESYDRQTKQKRMRHTCFPCLHKKKATKKQNFHFAPRKQHIPFRSSQMSKFSSDGWDVGYSAYDPESDMYAELERANEEYFAQQTKQFPKKKQRLTKCSMKTIFVVALQKDGKKEKNN